MEPFEEEIRADFQLKDEFVVHADQSLNKIKQIFAKQLKKRKPTFIAVHLRRSDASKSFSDLGFPALKPGYFFSAMDTMVNNLKVKKKSMIFVLVSDDHQWVKDNILPRVKDFNAIIAGNGDFQTIWGAAYDLALMSRCNHTILSFGSYSFWAGFLAGGMRITPATYFNGAMSKLSKMKPFTLPDDGMALKHRRSTGSLDIKSS